MELTCNVHVPKRCGHSQVPEGSEMGPPQAQAVHGKQATTDTCGGALMLCPMAIAQWWQSFDAASCRTFTHAINLQLYEMTQVPSATQHKSGTGFPLDSESPGWSQCHTIHISVPLDSPRV